MYEAKQSSLYQKKKTGTDRLVKGADYGQEGGSVSAGGPTGVHKVMQYGTTHQMHYNN